MRVGGATPEGREWMEKHADPFLALMNDTLTQRYPRSYGLLRLVLRRRAERELGKIRELVDSEAFQRTRRYLFLLYRVAPAVAEPAARPRAFGRSSGRRQINKAASSGI